MPIKDILVHIATNTTARWAGHVDNIKEMLLAKGYTDKQIRQLKKEGRIFVTPANLSRKIRVNESLWVMPPHVHPEDTQKAQKKESLDRFKDMTLE